MSGPIRKTISIVDKDFSPASYDHGTLSIELLPNGFSFALLHTPQLRYHLLEGFQADESMANHQSIVETLGALVDATPYLQQPYSQINIACFSQHLILVPRDVSSREDQEATFRLSCTVPEGHSIRVDRLNNLDAFGIYTTPDDLFNYLNRVFPSNTMIHSGSACIESLLATLHSGKWHPEMVLHIRQSFFEVLLFENNTLNFYKQFPYQDIDDLLYYLFYVLQQFQKDALKMHVMLAGEISVESINYERIASYFKDVQFVGRNDTYKYTPGFDAIPNHYYYNLLNLYSCE